MGTGARARNWQPSSRLRYLDRCDGDIVVEHGLAGELFEPLKQRGDVFLGGACRGEDFPDAILLERLAAGVDLLDQTVAVENDPLDLGEVERRRFIDVVLFQNSIERSCRFSVIMTEESAEPRPSDDPA